MLPEWIVEHGVDLVLAGGIGERAIIMLAEAGIRVMPGVAEQPVQDAVEAWLNGRLETHANVCRGGHHGHEHRHGSDDALS